MIKVNLPNNVDNRIHTTVGKLYRDFSNENAFMGKCGNGPENQLYLIGWNSIFLASDLTVRAWSDRNCPVTINEFVDIEITPILRGE
jgi:hypothetical protein